MKNGTWWTPTLLTGRVEAYVEEIVDQIASGHPRYSSLTAPERERMLRFGVRSEIRRFLETRGYQWVAELDCDDGYVADALIGRTSWRSRAWRHRLAR